MIVNEEKLKELLEEWVLSGEFKEKSFKCWLEEQSIKI